MAAVIGSRFDYPTHTHMHVHRYANVSRWTLRDTFQWIDSATLHELLQARALCLALEYWVWMRRTNEAKLVVQQGNQIHTKLSRSSLGILTYRCPGRLILNQRKFKPDEMAVFITQAKMLPFENIMARGSVGKAGAASKNVKLSSLREGVQKITLKIKISVSSEQGILLQVHGHPVQKARKR